MVRPKPPLGVRQDCRNHPRVHPECARESFIGDTSPVHGVLAFDVSAQSRSLLPRATPQDHIADSPRRSEPLPTLSVPADVATLRPRTAPTWCRRWEGRTAPAECTWTQRPGVFATGVGGASLKPPRRPSLPVATRPPGVISSTPRSGYRHRPFCTPPRTRNLHFCRSRARRPDLLLDSPTDRGERF